MISCDKSVSLKCFCPISLTPNNFIHYCRVTLYSLEHAFVKTFLLQKPLERFVLKGKCLGNMMSLEVIRRRAVQCSRNYRVSETYASNVDCVA